MIGAVVAAASADCIYLTNGHALVGLILEETDEHVTLDIGAGTARIYRSRIVRMEKSDAVGRNQIVDEWARKYFLHRKFVPLGFEALARSFRELMDLRLGTVTALRLAEQRAKRETAIRRELDESETRLVDWPLNRMMSGDFLRQSRQDSAISKLSVWF